MKTFMITFLLAPLFLIVHGDNSSLVVNLSEELSKYDKGKSRSGKEALRYGFQKTEQCKDFVKAFVCVRKCLDLNYDIAYSDRNCKCTCYKNKEKARYTPAGRQTRTRYRSGAPTTSRPIWAQLQTEQDSEDDNAITINESEENSTISNTTESNENVDVTTDGEQLEENNDKNDTITETEVESTTEAQGGEEPVPEEQAHEGEGGVEKHEEK